MCSLRDHISYCIRPATAFLVALGRYNPNPDRQTGRTSPQKKWANAARAARAPRSPGGNADHEPRVPFVKSSDEHFDYQRGEQVVPLPNVILTRPIDKLSSSIKIDAEEMQRNLKQWYGAPRIKEEMDRLKVKHLCEIFGTDSVTFSASEITELEKSIRVHLGRMLPVLFYMGLVEITMKDENVEYFFGRSEGVGPGRSLGKGGGSFVASYKLGSTPPPPGHGR